jgi:hypothetical protein
MADEQQLVQEWLHSTLNADPTLITLVPGKYWPDSVPQTLPGGGAVRFPAGSYQLMAGTDLIVVDGRRVWSNQIWLVKLSAVVGDEATFPAAVARQDELLRRVRGVALGGGPALSCFREASYNQPVLEEGVSYRQRGGQYRIYVTGA